MGDTLKCAFTKLHGTPVLVLPEVGPEAKRIFGATHMERDGVWLFPAYYPYVEDVLHDMNIVFPEVEFSEVAQEHNVRELLARTRVEEEPLPDGAFITEPFSHQREGTKFMLEYLRAALFFDCGLGKTKTVVDALRILREKTLVLSPVVGVRNWCREVALHSGGDLKAFPLFGESERAREFRLEGARKQRKLKKELAAATENKTALLRELEVVKKQYNTAAVKKVDLEEAAASSDVLVVSYDTAKLYQNEIFEMFPYSIIVADESHMMRGYKSQRTKMARALATKAYRRVLLSGTPTLGNPLHLFGQLAFLAPYIPAPDIRTFQRRFLIKGTKKYNNRMIFGYKNLDLLNEIVQRVALRKTRSACLDLPPRTIIDVDFTLSAEQKRFYNDLVSYSLISLTDGRLYESDQAAVVLQKLMQVTSGFVIVPPPPICDGCQYLQQCVDNKIKPYTGSCKVQTEAPPREIERMKKNGKLDAFVELTDSILAEPANKLIVWCNFIEELNIVEEYLKKEEIGYVRVDGSTSKHVQSLADKFNSDPETRVYLAQVGTGVAITLNSAGYMIYYGLTYKLDEYLQSMDRNYRIGQDNPVFVYRLIDENSVLSFIASALEMKENLAETLTSRIDCVLCAMRNDCIRKNIKPFEKGCIHPSRVKRVITKPGVIE